MLFPLLALFRPLAIDLASLRSFLTLVLGNIRVRLFAPGRTSSCQTTRRLWSRKGIGRGYKGIGRGYDGIA